MTRDFSEENPPGTDKSVSDFFETEFTALDFESQVGRCDSYELLPLFCQYLPESQPVLEAGCGSGRWVAWFTRKGIEATGLDWSKALCEYARAAIPGSRFESGDMRDMPFQDGEFGSIIALGSIEHAFEGPTKILSEFFRVLRPDGLAIITVPYGGTIRKLLRASSSPLSWIKANSSLRRLLNKPAHGGVTLKEATGTANPEWWPVFKCGKDGWHFYEYHFSKAQMRQFLHSAGFDVEKEMVAFHSDGILFNFGRIAGTYDEQEGKPRLSLVGTALLTFLPASWIGHMLCCT